MKPLKLQMKAFGAYREETIDFSDLEKESLFLISGPTGAGKSTIFDAMTYALYGKPSGTHKTEYDLVSDFAEEGEKARVGLTFEIRGKAYYVQRGLDVTVSEGSKSFKSTDMAFYPVGEEEKTLSKKSEIDSAVTSLIGLDYDQFKQTIMIPQGEFRELLTADSAKREAAFQEIFDTVFYKRFEIAMDQQAKTAYGELKDLEKERNNQFDQLGHLNEKVLEEALGQENRHYEALLVALASEREDLKERISVQKGKMEAQREEIEALSATMTIGEQKNARFALLKERKEALEALEKDREKIDQKKDQLKRLGILARLSGLREAFAREEKALALIQKELETLKETEKKLAKDYTEAKEKYEKRPAWQKALEEAQDVQSRLKGLAALYGNLDALEKEIERLSKARDQEDKVLKSLQDQRKVMTEKIKALEASIRASEDVGGELVTSEERGRQLGKEKKALEAYGELETNRETHGKLLAKAKEALDFRDKGREQADRELERLREMHLAHQVFVLAEALEEGVPCPVCGSEDHPAPAHPSGEEDRVSEALLEEKEKALVAADKAVKEAQTAVQLLEKEIGVIEAQAASQLELVTLEAGEKADRALARVVAAHKKEQDHYRNLQGSKKKRLEDQKRLSDLQDQLTVLEDQLEKARLQVEETTRKRDITETSLSGTRKQIPEDLPDRKTYDERMRALDERIARLKKQIDAVEKAFKEASETLGSKRAEIAIKEKDLAEQTVARQEAEKTFDMGLEKEGFADKEAYEKEKETLSGLDTVVLEHEVTSYQKQLAALQVQVEDLDKELAGHAEVDLSALKEKREGLRTALDDLVDREQKRVTDEQIMGHVLRETKRLSKEIEERENAYHEVRTLADLALGKNSQKMHLNSYVLRIYLNRVLKAANARLKTMTGGRFTLFMAEHSTGKSKNAGLDLEVHDFYTGKKRSVKSLSGGESFKTAMAFALGVSDIIRHTAGGIQLNTLFIDEGFGTLDTESLDQAIEMLIELQADGRLIGIISHVPELKERIESKLTIEQTPAGSKAKFVKM